MNKRPGSRPLPPPSPSDPLTAASCSAARKLLGWNGVRLAQQSGVSETTVRRLEAGAAVHPRRLESMRRALEDAGIAFAEDGRVTLHRRRTQTGQDPQC